MKNEWLSCAAVAATLLTAPVWAGDANSADSSGADHSQMMKDCMARQKAKDSTMSTDELKKACKDEMKMKGDPSMKTDTPNRTTPATKGDPAPQTASPNNPPR